ncbi:MAG: cobalamin biosynthesis protein CbiD [Mogibacterium sp.]|nr:cobalamin biosynthesis protein CbiD [Mogibacterium sp.]
MKKELRSGFTTGSCAAAAAKAAAYMLLSGGVKENMTITTPKGSSFDAKILDIQRGPGFVSCAVRKDGGDDPDVTTGALIYAKVCLADEEGISIDGGEGVGRVTRPGLDQPVGSAAINSVPRAMIRQEVTEVASAFDHKGGFSVIISVPEGEEIASHTFNPRLGIEGGISIIGTSGVVEPMSEKALTDTIRVELSQKKAEGNSIAFVSPGNYGLDFMRETYGMDLDRSVKCSNYIGLTVDMVNELGFEGMLLTGHAGKLVKVAGGIMNTHSREADGRMEIIAAAAAREGAGTDLILGILGSLTTEEAFKKIKEASCGDLFERVARRLMDSIIACLRRRAGEDLRIECIMYTKENGLIAASEGALAMIEENRDIWNDRL